MTRRKQVQEGRFFVGSVGVDSGMIFLSDPAYIKHYPSLYDPTKWSDFCMSLPNEEAFQMNDGVFTHTNFGDGEYPVYVTYDEDGRPKKIEVIFTRMTSSRDMAKGVQYK